MALVYFIFNKIQALNHLVRPSRSKKNEQLENFIHAFEQLANTPRDVFRIGDLVTGTDLSGANKEDDDSKDNGKEDENK